MAQQTATVTAVGAGPAASGDSTRAPMSGLLSVKPPSDPFKPAGADGSGRERPQSVSDSNVRADHPISSEAGVCRSVSGIGGRSGTPDRAPQSAASSRSLARALLAPLTSVRRIARLIGMSFDAPPDAKAGLRMAPRADSQSSRSCAIDPSGPADDFNTTKGGGQQGREECSEQEHAGQLYQREGERPLVSRLRVARRRRR